MSMKGHCMNDLTIGEILMTLYHTSVVASWLCRSPLTQPLCVSDIQLLFCTICCKVLHAGAMFSSDKFLVTLQLQTRVVNPYTAEIYLASLHAEVAF